MSGVRLRKGYLVQVQYFAEVMEDPPNGKCMVRVEEEDGTLHIVDPLKCTVVGLVEGYEEEEEVEEDSFTPEEIAIIRDVLKKLKDLT